MSELISRKVIDDATTEFCNQCSCPDMQMFDLFREIISEAPTVDAVPVTRCKDCHWWRRNKDFSTQFGICGRFNAPTAKDGYCSAGRESEDNNDKT